MESHRKGDLTEAIVLTELRRREIAVSHPFGDNERYDLVAECGGGALVRVQVKTGWIADGRIQFSTQSTHTNSQGNVRKSYDGDVDVFVVYCYETETMYLVGEQEFDKSISLRVEEPEVHHRSINWAADFEFDERWPLDVAAKEYTHGTTDPTTVACLDALEAAGVSVWRQIRGRSERNVVVEIDGTLYRVRVETGFVWDGRIKVNPDETETDCYLVYCDDLDTVYAVDADEVADSFSLRVSEPERVRSDTKLAENYEIATNWPPV
ncbi:group I intron-associated PD-(D/E)XK endonuclease [Haloarchaeobius litoreus]|uniref:Group I intron-associated PD-(D/E)XK endonuclease n=1 Tax=Haloarchaeobius litoreus TaxID=755306 RepID=A0ABD6DMU8_9EURY|nr:group I intron-associated PD-(D/E)XK endonuclease [Haloarchaeobius litoreus]